ncbi:MAG: adenylate/guanylate cyclase domain-containing protein [Hyphomicrobiales bacterium]
MANALPSENLTRLPRRIVETIERQDQASEVLARLIQLTVVTTMAVLYLVSPKTDAGTEFSPVPFALAIYFALNVAGLIWALNRGLPNWAVYSSIFFDMSLLMVLIWSFHIQYQQPASFYLKAPTILYVFIFIAIRALRFESRFVLAAGFTAVAGWIAMVLYVITVDPSNTMITRDYVEYLTSNSILIGAELDKIISIILVTFILALALKRGHALLVTATSEQVAAKDLSRFFDQSVASQITGSDDAISAGEGVTRQAAILNVDLRGFTPMAAGMQAGEVMRTLTAYQRQIVPIIQKHGGTIDKFLGDGIMATFGALAPSETYAADALRAMDDIMAGLDRWNSVEGLKNFNTTIVNAAVASGPIAVGAVGDENRLEYTVIGAAVNLSAKLEKHNKAAGCRALTTAETYRKAVEQGYTVPHSPQFKRQLVDGTKEPSELAILHI